MQRTWIAGVILGALLVAPMDAQALVRTGPNAKVVLSLTKFYIPSPWTEEVSYYRRALKKLTFGLKNALLGWTDLITETKDALEREVNPLLAVGVGIKDAVENTLGGVVHTATFPITFLDAPLPEGGTWFPLDDSPI